MNPDIERLMLDVADGEVTAFAPLADLLADEGHPHAEELVSLAITITEETDWAVVLYAIAVYQELLKGQT